MSIADKAEAYNRFVQASFQNAMDTVQRVHQRAAEIPVDVLQVLGLPRDCGDRFKGAHGEVIDILYQSISSAHAEVGRLVVDQVENMSRLAEDFGRHKDD